MSRCSNLVESSLLSSTKGVCFSWWGIYVDSLLKKRQKGMDMICGMPMLFCKSIETNRGPNLFFSPTRGKCKIQVWSKSTKKGGIMVTIFWVWLFLALDAIMICFIFNFFYYFILGRSPISKLVALTSFGLTCFQLSFPTLISLLFRIYHFISCSRSFWIVIFFVMHHLFCLMLSHAVNSYLKAWIMDTALKYIVSGLQQYPLGH